MSKGDDGELSKKEVYKNTKQYLILAVREAKKLKCECAKDITCDRCSVIMHINSINNYVNQFIELEEGLKEAENNKLTPYERIERFIKQNRYTYKVDDILDEYRNKWGKCYVSYTMEHCIKSLEDDIKLCLTEAN